MIEFNIQNLEVDPPSLNIDEQFKALVNIDGTLLLSINGEKVFHEHINLVDLAYQLNQWVKSRNGKDFKFDSLCFDETNIFTFKSDVGGYIFKSIWSTSNNNVVIDSGTLNKFIAKFYDTVLTQVEQKLFVNLCEVGL